MVEDAVVIVKERLTNEMVEAGAEFVAKLDEMGFPVRSALWLFVPEMEDWRLLISSPRVLGDGTREVHRITDVAAKALGPVAEKLLRKAVYLVDLNVDFRDMLKKGLKTGPGISRIHLRKDVIGGHIIDEALIYRNTADW